MSYFDYDDLIARYNILESWGTSSVDVSSNLIYYGCIEFDQRFAPYYTTPFSPAPLAVVDLSIDFTYCKGLRGKDWKHEKQCWESITDRIDYMLENGVVTDSGTIIEPGNASQEVWSSNKEYYSTFSMLDTENSQVDPDLLDDEVDERK